MLEGDEGVRRLMRGNFVMCPTCCYRRERLPAQPFDGRWRMVLDLDLLTRLLFAGEVIVGIPVPLYEYRRHEESATEHYTKSLLRFEEEFALYDEVARQSANRGWNRTAAVARKKRILKLNLVFRITRDLFGGRWHQAARKHRYLVVKLRESRLTPADSEPVASGRTPMSASPPNGQGRESHRQVEPVNDVTFGPGDR